MNKGMSSGIENVRADFRRARLHPRFIWAVWITGFGLASATVRWVLHLLDVVGWPSGELFILEGFPMMSVFFITAECSRVGEGRPRVTRPDPLAAGIAVLAAVTPQFSRDALLYAAFACPAMLVGGPWLARRIDPVVRSLFRR